MRQFDWKDTHATYVYHWIQRKHLTFVIVIASHIPFNKINDLPIVTRRRFYLCRWVKKSCTRLTSEDDTRMSRSSKLEFSRTNSHLCTISGVSRPEMQAFLSHSHISGADHLTRTRLVPEPYPCRKLTRTRPDYSDLYSCPTLGRFSDRVTFIIFSERTVFSRFCHLSVRTAKNWNHFGRDKSTVVEMDTFLGNMNGQNKTNNFCCRWTKL